MDLQKKLDIFKKICYNILILNLSLYILILLVTPKGVTYTKLNNMGYEVPPKISNKEAYIKILKFSKDAYIAETLSATKYPYLLAAIAKRESDYRPQIVGDHGSSYGLYQIQQRHWGVVHHRITDQTLQAERILDGLIRRYGVRKAVVRWNGSGRKAEQYAKAVFQTEKEIRRM